jgi:hypothetical protein
MLPRGLDILTIGLREILPVVDAHESEYYLSLIGVNLGG